LITPGSELEKVIVFGASGFIGKNLHAHIQQKPNLEITGYSSSECDLLDPPSVQKALKNCDRGTSIVLCSAIPRRKEDSWAAMLKNITMVHNVCVGIPAAGVRSFVFISSADVYGAHSGIATINEKTPANPKNHYGVSKLASEIMLPIELPPQTPISILRLPGVYGAGDKGNSIVGVFVEKLLRGETIDVTGEGKSKRDYLHMKDLCQVVESFLRQPFSGVVNVATGVSTSIVETAMIAAKVLGKAPAVKLVPSPAEEYDLIFDTSRLTQLMPKMRFMELEKGITEYAESYKKTRPISQMAT